MAGLLDVSDYVTCPICFEVLSTPKTLPCEHSYCMQCLASILKTRIVVKDDKIDLTELKIDCPTCKLEIKDFQSLSSLKTSRLVRDLVNDVRKKTVFKEASFVDKKCSVQSDVCLEIPVLMCVRCDAWFCEKCFDTESCSRPKTVSENLSWSRRHCLGMFQHMVFRKIDDSTYTCPVHNLSVEFFCLDCKIAICIECYLLSHKHHNARTTTFAKKDVVNLSARCKSVADGVNSDWCKLRDTANDMAKEIEDKSNATLAHLKELQIDCLGYLCLAFDRTFEHFKGKFDAKKKEILEKTNRDAIGYSSNQLPDDPVSLPQSHELKVIALGPKFQKTIDGLKLEKQKITAALDSLQSKSDGTLGLSLTLDFMMDKRKMLEHISKAFRFISLDSTSVSEWRVEIPKTNSEYEDLRSYLRQSDFIKTFPDACPLIPAAAEVESGTSIDYSLDPY